MLFRSRRRRSPALQAVEHHEMMADEQQNVPLAYSVCLDNGLNGLVRVEVETTKGMLTVYLSTGTAMVSRSCADERGGRRRILSWSGKRRWKLHRGWRSAMDACRASQLAGGTLHTTQTAFRETDDTMPSAAMSSSEVNLEGMSGS